MTRPSLATVLVAALLALAPARGAVMPTLSSLPASSNKVVLVFAGSDLAHDYPGTAEQEAAIWREAAQPYVDPLVRSLTGALAHAAPLNVDITTIDPAPSFAGRVARLVIGDVDFTPAVGGYAYTYGLLSGAPYNLGQVFPAVIGGIAAVRNIGRAVAHEIGHLLGLSHQSTATSEYNPGDADVAPIMGLNYNAARVAWYDGWTNYGVEGGTLDRQDDYPQLVSAVGVVPEPGVLVAMVGGALVTCARRRKFTTDARQSLRSHSRGRTDRSKLAVTAFRTVGRSRPDADVYAYNSLQKISGNKSLEAREKDSALVRLGQAARRRAAR